MLVVTGLGQAAAAGSGVQDPQHQQQQPRKWKVSLHKSLSVEQQIKRKEICTENIILHPFWVKNQKDNPMQGEELGVLKLNNG